MINTIICDLDIEIWPWGRKIYEFLSEPYFSHRFDNLDQVSVNGLSYDDRVVGSNMHKLFDGPIRKVYNPYIEKTSEIDQKYNRLKPSKYFNYGGVSHYSCSS